MKKNAVIHYGLCLMLLFSLFAAPVAAQDLTGPIDTDEPTAHIQSVGATSTVPAIPTGLKASGVGANKFTANWTHSSGATSYELYRKEGTSPTARESKVATINDTGATDKLDLVFILDYSGSMDDDIANVRSNISTFVNTLKNSSVDFQLGIVLYADLNCSPPDPMVKHPFTNSVSTFTTILSGVSANYGCYPGESLLEAIAHPTQGAISFPFREGSSKQFVVLTDERTHDNADGDGGDGYSTYDIDAVVSQLVSSNIKLHMIAPESTTIKNQLSKLSTGTQGTYVNIFSTSFATEMTAIASNIVSQRSYEFTGLKEATQYSVRVKACTTTCSTFSEPLVVTTTSDTTAPTKPTGLEADDITTKSFVLGWNPATDDVAVAKYFVRINGNRITKGTPAIDLSTTGVSMLVSSLSATATLTKNTTYSVTVEACDVKNNCSISDPISVKTNEKSQPPSAPEDLIAFNVARDTFILSWTEAEDDEGIQGYKVYIDSTPEDGNPPTLYDGDIGPTETELVISGLTAGSTYSMTVSAIDLDNQESTESDELDVTTLGADESMGPEIKLTRTKGAVTASSTTFTYLLKKRAATEGDPGYSKSSAKLTARLINKAKVQQGPNLINNVDTPVAKLRKLSVSVSAATISSGKYYVIFTAVDPTDNKKKSFAYKRLVVDKIAPIISDIDAPNITNDTVPKSITYDLAENNSSGTLVKNEKTRARLTVVIKNKATGKVVKTLMKNKFQLSGENKNISWNVKDSKGIRLPDGLYTITFDAIDVSKNKAVTKSVDFSIERSAPIISAVSDKPDPLTVAGTNVSTIKYSLSEKATVKIEVVDKDGNLIRTLVNNVLLDSGARTITWNGKNSSNVKVAAGKYTYKIDATDTASKQAVQMTGTITVK